MIKINEEKKIFNLTTKNTQYLFCVDNEGLIRHLYWGKNVNNYEEFDIDVLTEISTNDPVYEITKEEFPVYGGLRYKENCLKVSFKDGTRDIVYKYIGYETNKDTLIINLKDMYYNLVIKLHYKVIEKNDLIERYVSIENNTEEEFVIEEIYSGQMHIPYENLRFSNTHGHWGAEQQKFTQSVSYGKIYIENRRGISGHNHNPYFILDKEANETSGEVFFGVFKHTGNFKGIVEQTAYGETLVQVGLNPYDFELKLKPNEEFTTPSILIGYTDKGFGSMSNNLHDYAKENILKKGVRPILYNSWEATEFDVTCDQQIKLAKKAKEIGAELFVVDDGWFGERNSIHNGLGDWYVNEEKFPNGLDELINEVKKLDMKFGIWVEPEMVNPLSRLYKEHPEWIYNFNNRHRTTSRGQYVLNMTNNEVQEYIYKVLDDLLSTYEISYIKWDANRPISEPGAKNLGDNEKILWYEHIQAVYKIVRKLKEKHKNVLFEACASGGGRIDYGILEVFDDFWTSDNTDAYDRLFIQNTYSYIYPIKAMRAWVTDSPNFLSKRNIPLGFRFDSAMMGTLGIGSNILKFNENEIEICKSKIEQYKNIRHIIQDGNFYRLEDISSNGYHCFEYTKDNEALLFVFLPQSKIGHKSTRIKLRGLEKEKIYEFKYNNIIIAKSGEFLMNYGIIIQLEGDYASETIHFIGR